MATITLEFPNGFWTLDNLLWNYFRREYPGLVDQTQRDNPQLAFLGVHPPKGTKVTVTLPTGKTSTPAALITLWSDGS